MKSVPSAAQIQMKKLLFPVILLLALLHCPHDAFASGAGAKIPIILSPKDANLEKAGAPPVAAPLVAVADSDGFVSIQELQPDEGAQTTWNWNVVVPKAGKWKVMLEYRGAGGLEVRVLAGNEQLSTETSATAGGRLLQDMGALDLPEGRQTLRVRVTVLAGDPAKTVPAHGVELRDFAPGPVTRPDFLLGGLALFPAGDEPPAPAALRAAVDAARPRMVPSQLWLPAIFSDHMVLQREKPVPVWGRAKPGATVAVALGEAKAEAKADDAGRWMVRLQPMRASAAPRELRVTDGENALAVSDVLVGEVWFGSGQSNMEVAVYKWNRNGRCGIETDEETKAFIAQTDFSQVRVSALTRDHLKIPGWTVVTEENRFDLPAQMLCSAALLHERCGVPVGIIVRCSGGSPTAIWVDRDAVDGDAEIQRQLSDYTKKYASLVSGYETKTLPAWRQQVEQMKADGRPGPAKPPRPPRAGGYFQKYLPDGFHDVTGSAYESRIAPVIPFAVRGIVWDQGESGTGIAVAGPFDVLRVLVESWRQAWAEPELPFLWFRKNQYPPDMERRMSTIPNTRMIDNRGLQQQIHPPDKLAYSRRVVAEMEKVTGQAATSAQTKADERGSSSGVPDSQYTGSGRAAPRKAPADYVEPRIDTHKSRWFYFSSACRPFGMVNLSPDTKVGGDWMNGYIHGEKSIQCFSHVHGWQLYGIPVMPSTGELRSHKGLAAAASPFSHDDEVVHPGYHKVVLQRYGITAELTSTARVGFHRYTFPAGEKSFIAFDTGATLMDRIDSSAVRQAGPDEIAGHSVMSATTRRPKPFTVYFVAKFSKPVEFGAWKDGELNAEAKEVSGPNVGGYAQFATRDREQVLMKVAISYTSEENARKNLEAELPGWDFDSVASASREEWNEWLGRIAVEGGTEAQRVKFYTDLWHALLGRRTVSDADGSYCDNTGSAPVTRRVRLDAKGRPLFSHYNFDALWGSQWSLNILWSFAYPEVMDGFCNTMVDMYRNSGLIPRGPSGGNYTFVMIGDPASTFFAAAYNKGIRSYDAELAYEGLRKNALPGGIRDHAGYEHAPDARGGGMKYYVERGYVPEGIEGKGSHKDGAAMTLEYAWQDWCLAQFALALGRNNDADWLTRRSGNYANLWDASVGYMRPRNKDGSWLADFSPAGKKGAFSTKGFCEANSAIYTHAVPHDMPGLIRLFGGQEKYVAALNRQFELAGPSNFIVPHGEHGGAWVDYDNQPSTEMAHLFNLAGAPWLSQKWVRAVKEKTFGDITPSGGYNGDEDQGQMGALGVLMAIGLFDVQGGAALKPTYQITSPVFDRVTIRLNKQYYPGGEFVIATRNNSPENIYIQSARLNGHPLDQCWFPHAGLARGGKLELELGPRPSRWGAGSASIPSARDQRE